MGIYVNPKPTVDEYAVVNGLNCHVYHESYPVSWKQDRPFIAPLPYEAMKIWSQGNGSWSNTDVALGANYRPGGYGSAHFETAQRKAYASFVNKMQHLNHASLGITIAQYQQAMNMVGGRLATLLGVARNLKKGNFRKAARMLNLGNKTTAAHRRKPADWWLEYTFGWTPLIQDVHSAIAVLQSDPPPLTVRSGGFSEWDETRFLGPDFPAHRTQGIARVRYRADIRCSNPNLYFANQMGLINPAAIVWDGIPFSFVVDWFVPVNRFLNSWTNFVGLELTNYCTTFSHSFVDGSESSYLWNGVPRRKMNTGKWMKRVLEKPSLPLPSVSSFTWDRVTPWHAATTASLLIQQLRRF